MNHRIVSITVVSFVVFSAVQSSFFRTVALNPQEGQQIVKQNRNSADILTVAAEEIAKKLCEDVGDEPLVQRSILSMDRAMKGIKNETVGRFAVSVLVLVPPKDYGKSYSNKLHDDNIDFFLSKIISKEVSKPIATTSVVQLCENGKYSCCTIEVVDN